MSIILKDDNGNPLSPEVTSRVDAYIERIKVIKWFQPSKDLSKESVEKQVKFTLECFGVKAGIEYRSLKTPNDWDAARGAARGAAWGAAWDAARDAARGAARGAAWDAARGAQEALLEDNKDFTSKYKNGAFLQFVTLYEMGLYPVGVINGNFVVYVPPCSIEFPDELK